MAEMKTQKNNASVEDFLNGVTDEKRREDSFGVLELMREVTGEEPAMWGTSIVGFGSYHYKYASGREGDWPLAGFSPRKRDLSLYIMAGFERYPELMSSLGKHKTGKSCLYIKRLDDVDQAVLKELVAVSVRYMRQTYGQGKE